MVICYFGAYDRSYARNRVLIGGLPRAAVRVIECHSEHVVKPIRWLSLAVQFFARALRADAVVVGACGHAYVPLAWVLASAAGIPLVFDAFVSRYEVEVVDRRAAKIGSLRAKLCFWMDKIAGALADVVLLDTEVHADYWSKTFGLPRTRLLALLVGEETSLFGPADEPEADVPFVVSFAGTYIPLQGTQYILQAAKLLDLEPGIRFDLIGTGQTYAESRRLADRLGLRNVRFLDPVSIHALPAALAGAHVCLGVFGDTEKTPRVIPNKVFQAMAMGKALITADTPAAREVLLDRHNALLVHAADPPALASAILELRRDPTLRRRLGRNGLATFRERSTPEILGRRLAAICSRLALSPTPAAQL